MARLLAMLVALTFNIHRPKDAQPMTEAELLPPILRARAGEAGPTSFSEAQAFLAEFM